ncbi:probable G-protein coupled receptor 142 [Conger conger]|uniref:probable G-protein coupled receptor 142 n=1 Tax=Conger conger TaxID=82655 RepID=UPI002A5A1A90|nr:probable G-protein coupled receptor 142 [Conger conger]
MSSWSNTTDPSGTDGHSARDPQSECVLGYIPVIYYSALLCVGVPVNILTAVALWRLALCSKKVLYVYLLALTGADILTQLFIVFVGFLLETAVFHRKVPALLLHSVSVLEFSANHAAVWTAVPLTVDRYVALCHPLQHRRISYPSRARRVVGGVFSLALLSGVPFYWWTDLWREGGVPTATDGALIWTHVTIIYFLPCAIFLVLNSLIVLRLRRGRGQSPSAQAPRRLGKTTATLLAVTSSFCVLWAPRTAVVMYHLYGASVRSDWRVHLAYDLANMVAMLNTAVNFFLYCFTSPAFRQSVRAVLLLRGAEPAIRRHAHHQAPPTAAGRAPSTSSLSSGAKPAPTPD